MTRFETARLGIEPDAHAPDGAEVRLLGRLAGGSMAHFRLPAGRVSRPVTHRTVEELAAQITRLLLEPTLAAKLGAHAARRAHSVLRWDSAQRSLLAVYDRLLGTSLLSAHRSPAETPVSGPEWPHEAASLSAV